MVQEFKFKQAKNTAVFVCAHIVDDNAPILYVIHEGDGDWQFLCEGQHADAKPKLICLEHVVGMDPTLNELADLQCNHSAERAAIDAKWRIVDEDEQTIRNNIDEHGWHIAIVNADAEGPGFAYSIGMQKTLAHPEIIVFGLPGKLMGSMINEIGRRVQNGEPPLPRESVHELIDEAECILWPVSKSRFPEFFGYARWYYKGDNFEALQCFWPGKIDKLFPWEPGANEYVCKSQPDLRNPLQT